MAKMYQSYTAAMNAGSISEKEVQKNMMETIKIIRGKEFDS